MAFEYDLASRRARLVLANGVSTEYDYDGASRLTSLTFKLATTNLGDVQYLYDASGNRIQVSGSWARTSLPEELPTAVYSAANQQTTFGAQTLISDVNGNLTWNGENTYAWDARNRLVSIEGAISASFSYDAAGRRTRKAVADSTTDFTYDGLNVLREVSGATSMSNLVGLRMDEYFTRTNSNGTITSLLTDALGSTIAVTNDAGAVETEYTYDAYGRVSNGSGENPFQYTCRENDATGLYYHRARYYHPGLQRFIGEDPIGFAGRDVNLYAYVRNNPLRYSDPLGLEKKAPDGWSPFIPAGDVIPLPAKPRSQTMAPLARTQDALGTAGQCP